MGLPRGRARRQGARRQDKREAELPPGREARQRAGEAPQASHRPAGASEDAGPHAAASGGWALVVPASMLHGDGTRGPNGQSADAEAKRKTELRAMDAVAAIERELGHDPKDVSDRRKIGYDIESRVPDDLRDGTDPMLRMIEVKGRLVGADTVTLSKNEILAALNKPDCWLLAIVEIDGASAHTTYLRRPALRTPAFTETSATFDIGRLTKSAEVVLERTDTWQ